jgi:transcriptional regulator GlxA family with amidase domain
LSSRQFSRRFFRAYKQTPAHYVENLRLAEAQGRLTSTNARIDAVAASVGFASADSFRRAFERRFSLPPTAYRRRFSGRTPNARARSS